MSSSDDDFVAPAVLPRRPKLSKFSKKPRPASPVVRAMAAGCDQSPAAAVQNVSDDPADVRSPSQAIAESLLRHLAAGTKIEDLEDPMAVACAGVCADIEKEVVLMADLRTRAQALSNRHYEWRLAALDDQVKVIQEAVRGLQRAVLQLQEGSPTTPK